MSSAAFTVESRSAVPVGLFGEHKNTIVLVDPRPQRFRIDLETPVALDFDRCALDCSGNLTVHRIRRLERENGSAVTAICETQRLEHLVRTVRHEHAAWVNAFEFTDRRSQRRGGPVRVPIPGQLAHTSSQLDRET